MQTQQMNERQWEIAHNIAFDLVDGDTDPNEFGKVVAFVRRHQDDNDAKFLLMSLVQRLANSRNALIRSRKTQGFYRNIQEACRKHLRDISDPAELLLILGWSMRLMRYYRVEPTFVIEELPPIRPHTPPPPVPEPEKPKVEVGDRVNATVLKKQGSQVTVQLQTEHNEELTFEQPYYPGQVGKPVRLRVQAVDGEGKVTKVIP